MKRPSFRNRSALVPPRARIFGLSVLVLVLFVASIRYLAPGLFVALSTPLFSVGTSITDSIRDMSQAFTDKETLVRERDALLLENTTLRNENAENSAQLATYEELIGSGKKTDGITADVVARPPLSPYDTLLIDKGTQDGVAQNSVVTAEGGVPIGTVAEVSASAARVLLFSTSDRETQGFAGTKHVPTTFIGRGAGAFTATLPKEAVVTVGDLVFITSGRVFGSVGRIDSSASSPTLQVYVQPLVNLFTIQSVLVLPLHAL